MSNQYILCVDPGGITMGACLFDLYDFEDESIIAPPIHAITVDLNRKKVRPYSDNSIIAKLIQALEIWFEDKKIIRCYCEKPRNFGSASSFAASIQGTLQRMDMFRGALMQLCCKHDCTFHDVPVTTWKGQLPKQLVIDRVKNILERGGCMKLSKDGHDWDACGIGLYEQGVF